MHVDKKFRFFYALATIQLILFLTYGWNLLSRKIPFFASYVDPEYEYLDNSLKILYGITPGHADHPGATLQLSLAIFFLFFKNTFKQAGNLDYRSSYVENPESYAVAYVAFFLIILTLALLLVIRKYKNDTASLIFTTYPVVLLLALSGQVGMLVRISPESLLILISTLLLLQILSSKEFLEYKEIKYKDLLLTGLILAAGVATKITFLPMFALLIFIRGFKRKIFLIISSIIFLILLVLPQRGAFSVTWFFNIFLNSGRWGQEREQSKSFDQIKESLINLWIAQYPYIGVVLLIFAVLLLVPKWNFKTNDKHLSNILVTLILAGSSLVVKESEPRDFSHLTPFGALLLLLFIRKLLRDIEPYIDSKTKKIPIVTLSAIFAVMFFNFAVKVDSSFLNIRHVILNNFKATDIQIFPEYEFDMITRSLMKDKNFVISQYRTPSEFAGLQFGNLYYGGSFLGQHIDDKYPYGLELNIWNSTVYNGLNEPVGCQYFSDALQNGTQVFIHSQDIQQTSQIINTSPHSYNWEFYKEYIEIKTSKLYKLKSATCK